MEKMHKFDELFSETKVYQGICAKNKRVPESWLYLGGKHVRDDKGQTVWQTLWALPTEYAVSMATRRLMDGVLESARVVQLVDGRGLVEFTNRYPGGGWVYVELPEEHRWAAETRRHAPIRPSIV